MKNKDSALVNIVKVVVLLLGLLSIAHNISILKDHPYFIVDIVVVCLAEYYMFVDYKVPHSNLLKVLFLLHVLELILDFWLFLANNAKTLDIADLLVLLSIAIVAYVSGRLDRYKENISLLIIAAIFAFISGIMGLSVFADRIISPFNLVGPFGKFIVLLSLIVPYVLRYKAHKDAGLSDKQ